MTPFKEPKRIAAASAAQRGAVLPTVMIMMMVLMMMGMAVLEYTGLSEVREVEKSLADVRAYWAMMGHFNYMASRASQQGLCYNTNKDRETGSNTSLYCSADFNGTAAPAATSRAGLTVGSIAGSLQDYLDHKTSNAVDELQSGTFDSPGVTIWTYPVRNNNDSFSKTHNGSPASNQFSVWGMVRPRDADNLAPSTNVEDGFMIMDLELERIPSSADTSITALRDIGKRVARLMIGFCVYDSKDAGSSKFDNKGCGATASGAASATEGTIKIQFIQRAINCASGSCASF